MIVTDKINQKKNALWMRTWNDVVKNSDYVIFKK